MSPTRTSFRFVRACVAKLRVPVRQCCSQNWAAGGQWAPTIPGRNAADNFSKFNSLPLIQYDPSVSLAGPNQYDNRNGLLFVEACNFGVDVLGPLAPFKTPPTSTLIG